MSNKDISRQHHEAPREQNSWLKFFKSYYFQSVVMPRLAHRFTIIGVFMLTYGMAHLLRAGDPTMIEQWFIAFGSVLFIVGSSFHLSVFRRNKKERAGGAH